VPTLANIHCSSVNFSAQYDNIVS